MSGGIARIGAAIGLGGLSAAVAAGAAHDPTTGAAFRRLPSAEEIVAIGAGEAHRYRTQVQGPNGLHVRVDQLGIDLVLELTSDGSTVHANAPGGGDREDLWLEAPDGTAAELVVRPKLRNLPEGAYRIRVGAPDSSDVPLDVLRELSAGGAVDVAETADTQQRALTHYGRALELLPDGTARQSLRALLMFRRAVLLRRLGRPADAVAAYREALALQEALSDRLAEARTRNGLGLTLLVKGQDTEPARLQFELAARAARMADDSYEIGSADNNLCLVHLHRGRPDLARPCFEQAVALYRSASLGEYTSIPLLNLAATYDLLGLPDLARASFEDALALRRGGVERLPVAQILLNLASLQRNTGAFADALASIDESIAVMREIGNKSQEARALIAKGGILMAVGLPKRAIRYLEQALPITLSASDRRAQADVLGMLGDLTDDITVARTRQREALTIFREIGDVRASAGRWLALAGIERRARRFAIAREAIAAARPLAEQSRSPNLRWNVEIESARIAIGAGDAAAAQSAVDAATALLPRSGGAPVALEVALIAAQTMNLAGRSAAARRHAERELLASLNFTSEGSSPELRDRERNLRAELLAQWIDWLGSDREIRTPARIAAVLGVIESVRRHEFDSWVAYLSNPVDNAQAELLRQLRQRRARLELAYREGDLERVALIESQLEESISALDRRATPNLARTKATRVDLSALQARLRADSAAMLLATGDQSVLRIWIDARSSRVDLLAGRESIERSAQAFTDVVRTLAQAGGRFDARPSRDLGARLLHGLDIARTRRIYVALDGVLHTIPFGALTFPGSDDLLAERLAVIHALEIERLDDRPRPFADARIAIIADPHVDSYPEQPAPAVVMRGDPSLPRLPATALEADAITQLRGSEFVSVRRGRAATAAGLIELLAEHPDILHIATHGVANGERIDGAAFMLAAAAPQPGAHWVGPREIIQNRIAAPLVVLSGCDTALGRSTTTASSFGLTEAFLAAGAEFVVSSLWPVDDQETGLMMEVVHERLLHDHTHVTDVLAARTKGRRFEALAASRAPHAFRVTVRESP
jgi:CHAT domain-containing protein/tetratricopeptide (TPR) repeat protein